MKTISLIIILSIILFQFGTMITIREKAKQENINLTMLQIVDTLTIIYKTNFALLLTNKSKKQLNYCIFGFDLSLAIFITLIKETQGFKQAKNKLKKYTKEYLATTN